MGKKLSTTGGSSGVVVNVRDVKEQFFVGKLLGHKTAKSQYKNADGTEKQYNIYEFSLEDTDMPLQKKEGKEYVEAAVEAGSTVSVFAPTRLNNALSQAEVGQKIKFVYLGMVKAGKNGGKAHSYDAEVL